MRFQDKPGTCGEAAVVNTLRAFGIKLSEKKVCKQTETDEHGTNEFGIMPALRYFGLTVEEFKGTKPTISWQWLHGALMHGRVIILCVDSWNHWVAAIGTLQDRIIIVDSSCTKANQAENGVHVLSRSRLLRRWAMKGGDCKYYGIAAGRN